MQQANIKGRVYKSTTPQVLLPFSNPRTPLRPGTYEAPLRPGTYKAWNSSSLDKALSALEQGSCSSALEELPLCMVFQGQHSMTMFLAE